MDFCRAFRGIESDSAGTSRAGPLIRPQNGVRWPENGGKRRRLRSKSGCELPKLADSKVVLRSFCVCMASELDFSLDRLNWEAYGTPLRPCAATLDLNWISLVCLISELLSVENHPKVATMWGAQTRATVHMRPIYFRFAAMHLIAPAPWSRGHVFGRPGFMRLLLGLAPAPMHSRPLATKAGCEHGLCS